MSIALAVKQALHKAGQQLIFDPEGEPAPFWGSIQPDCRAGREHTGPLGPSIPGVHTLYACHDDVSVKLKYGSRVSNGRNCFVVRQAEDVCIGGEIAYRWANLVREEECV